MHLPDCDVVVVVAVVVVVVVVVDAALLAAVDDVGVPTLLPDENLKALDLWFIQ